MRISVASRLSPPTLRTTFGCDTPRNPADAWAQPGCRVQFWFKLSGAARRGRRGVEGGRAGLANARTANPRRTLTAMEFRPFTVELRTRFRGLTSRSGVLIRTTDAQGRDHWG